MGFFGSLVNGIAKVASPVSALVSGFGNLATTSMANRANANAVRETNQANLELAKYNNKWNLEQWNRQNAYNSPAEQVKRLQAAGLNPHLVYGNGAVGNTSGQSPTAASVDLKAPHYAAYDASFVGQAGQAWLQQKQVDSNVEYQKTQGVAMLAQAAKSRAEAGLASIRAAGQGFDNYKARQLFKYDMAAANLAVKQAEQDLQKTIDYNNLNDERVTQVRLQNQLIFGNIAKTAVEAQKMNAEIRKIAQEIVYLQKQGNVADKNARLLELKGNAQSNENYQWLQTSGMNVDLVQEKLTNAIINNDIAELNYIAKAYGIDGGSLLTIIGKSIGMWIDGASSNIGLQTPHSSANRLNR